MTVLENSDVTNFLAGVSWGGWVHLMKPTRGLFHFVVAGAVARPIAQQMLRCDSCCVLHMYSGNASAVRFPCSLLNPSLVHSMMTRLRIALAL